MGWLDRGAEAEPHQKQILQTQAPSGAGRNCTQSLLILCAGRILQTLRGNPRKWGPGKGDYEHASAHRSCPRRRFAQSLVAPGEAQRSGFAGKRRSKGTNAVFAARRKRSGVDFATTSRHGQSHSSPAGGEIPSALAPKNNLWYPDLHSISRSETERAGKKECFLLWSRPFSSTWTELW